jgi:hypothetical protein
MQGMIDFLVPITANPLGLSRIGPTFTANHKSQYLKPVSEPRLDLAALPKAPWYATT